MTATWLSKTKNSFRIAVQVSPNARKSEIASAGDVLRIRLQAQPVDGKANEALIQFIAKKLRIPRKNIVISAKRYGIDALGAMAQGLFCSLLIGT